MTASNHATAKVVYAAGGIAAVLAICEAANLAARGRGDLAGAAVITMAFVACWVAAQLRTYRRQMPRPQRPAPVRLPEPAANLPEPAGSLT